MRYKVGNMVRVKTWEELLKEGYKTDSDGDLQVGPDYFATGMVPLGGRIFRVAEAKGDTVFYRLADDAGKVLNWLFFAEILDPVPEETPEKENPDKAKPTDAAIEIQRQMKEKFRGAYSRAVDDKMELLKQRFENNAVEHPSHYTAGGIECIDAIRDSLGLREFADYCKGNIIKYLWRYRLKNGVEDLKKAEVYLKWMIEAEEKSKGWGD